MTHRVGEKTKRLGTAVRFKAFPASCHDGHDEEKDIVKNEVGTCVVRCVCVQSKLKHSL